MPDIEQFVRRNPYCSFRPLHRLLGEELDPRYGGTCIDLALDYGRRVESATRFFPKDERGLHHGLVTSKDQEAWYWDPALQQAEPLALHKVWSGKVQDAAAFPVIRGHWSVLRVMSFGGRSFSVTKYVPTQFDEGPSHPVRNPLTQKMYFRFEERDFRSLPMDDFALMKDEDGFAFSCVQDDGSVVGLESPRNDAPFVGKSHGPDEIRTYTQNDLRTCLTLVYQSTGIPLSDLEAKLDELPHLMSQFRFIEMI